LDPITGFVSIVGLIGQFRSERSSNKVKEDTDFKEWLDENNHTELVNLLSNNSETLNAIQKIVNEDSNFFKEKFAAIENALLKFSSTIEGFDKISEGLSSNMGLSDQAISILQQFEDAGASKILETHTFGGASYMFLDGKSSNLEFDQEQFIEDDLATLVELRLLRPDNNSKGQKMFRYTRVALELIGKLNDS